ncbi:molybdopterin oxidoreductase family protein [Janibacter sp. GXQ6167]|uniref:molybdopterin oxidoreductase family protein n=1 Tax=Janibacter sp. GXQ6167 TaxID=3240791 RepID=UPI0035252B66
MPVDPRLDQAGVDSHCPYCALQCGQRLSPGPGPVPVTAQPRPWSTSGGGMCQKGWTSPEVLSAPGRLTTPLMRSSKESPLRPVSWDAALNRIVGEVIAIQRDSGRDAVAVFGGGGLTNEKAYTLGKWTRAVLRSRMIDYNGRFCMASAAAGANRQLGMDRGLPFPLSDLQGADAVVLLGSNLAETMPPAVAHLAGVRTRGGLIVVDPRRSATADLTENGAGHHLAPVPGTDQVVLLALAHVVLAEGLIDRAYLEARTEGLEALRRSVTSWWPERAEQVSGVPASTLRTIARHLAAASPAGGGRGAYLLTGRGVEQSTHGTDTVSAAINLALLLGLVGRDGSGYGAITGQGNGQGGREHGQKADQLPGYRSIENPAARAHVARHWGIDPHDLPGKGLSAIELLRALGEPSGPRALFVHGSNLRISVPGVTGLEERLPRLDLLVVSDVVMSETAQLADVVLPVTQWAEEEGTMTNLEGRLIRRRKVIDPPPTVRSELSIWSDLASRMGSPVVIETDPRLVFAELAAASAGGIADYSGITYERLDEGEEIYWPCPTTADGTRHPGTPRPFATSFPTASGRAHLVPVSYRPPTDDLRPGAPVRLLTGRVLAHYQSGAQTRRVPSLQQASPHPFVEIHPVQAADLGLANGDLITLRNERGRVVAPAQITDRVRPGEVFMPFHWPGLGRANTLIGDALDPVSAMPELKLAAVTVHVATSADVADWCHDAPGQATESEGDIP